jgi:DNA-3-methyladenine glycosylase
MFGPPGRAYVYLVYGMYDCLNVVTEPDASPAAILIRAVEIVEGEEQMRIDRVIAATTRRRHMTAERASAVAARIAQTPADRLASGPGLVCAAFGIDTRWSGIDLVDVASPLRLESPPADAQRPVVRTSPRLGIDYAGPDWAARPWRFLEADQSSVSGPTARR